jgi:hypothetical protein
VAIARPDLELSDQPAIHSLIGHGRGNGLAGPGGQRGRRRDSAGRLLRRGDGVTISFVVLDIVNIAHPAFIMLGSF